MAPGTRKGAADVSGREFSRWPESSILGIVMEIIYQLKVLDAFYPVQAATITILLAFVRWCGILRASRSSLGRPAGIELSDMVSERTMPSPNLKFDVNTELAARRTGMSFQRTRMSADRTLMSVIRTSLSLIGFGFTITQVFEKLRDQGVITKAAAPRNFGVALVGLGILMLTLGIVYHVQFMLGLRRLRASMREEGLVHGETVFPLSLTLTTAFVLLVIGVATIVSMAFHVGPFE